MTVEIYKSSLRSTQDIGGVLECEDALGFFYLFDNTAGPGQKIVGHIKLDVDVSTLRADDFAIRWDATNNFVGIFVHNELHGYFDVKTRRKWTRRTLQQMKPGAPSPAW